MCFRSANTSFFGAHVVVVASPICVDERQPRYRQPSHPAFALRGVYLSFVRKRECCTTRQPSGYLRCEHLFKAVLIGISTFVVVMIIVLQDGVVAGNAY